MRKLLHILISYILPAVVVGYIVLKVSPGSIFQTLAQVDPVWLLLGFIIFGVNILFRSLRFKRLIFSQEIDLKDIFQVSCLHTMYNYLLPARTGEFSYAYFLKKLNRISFTEGLSTLLVARILDLMTIVLLLPVVLYSLRDHIPGEHLHVIIIVACMVLLICVLFIALLVKGEKTLRIVETIGQFFRISRFRVFQYLQKKFEEFHAFCLIIHKNRIYLPLICLTCFIWLSVYGYFYCIAQSLHIQISFVQMILILMIMVPTRLLPLQGVGNVGTHEIGWVFALRIFGFSQEIALLMALNSHIILFVYVISFGLYAILSTKKKEVRR